MAIPRTLKPLTEYLEQLEGAADLQQLEQILGELDVCREKLEPVCRFQRNTYSRNVVSQSEHYELCVICWKSGQGSSIHDHLGSSCALKIVHGIATETGFEQTASGKVTPAKTRIYQEGEICASPSEDYIHQIVNAQDDDKDLITLHIYSPPLKMNTYELDETVPEAVEYGKQYMFS